MHRNIVISSLCLFALPVFLHAESQRPILFFGSGRGAVDCSAIIGALQSQAGGAQQWEIVEGGEWVEPREFSAFSSVVISVSDSPKIRHWTSEDIEEIEKWIEEGGRMILIGSTPILLSDSGPDLGILEKLLGARQATKSQSSTWANTDSDFASLDTSAEPSWMTTGGTALRGLTHVQSIVGWVGENPGVLCGTTTIGKGKVLYLGISPSRYSNTPEFTSIMDIITTFIRGANPAKTSMGKGGWGIEPLGPTAPVTADPVAPIKRELKSNFVSRKADGPDLILAENGKSLGAIVLPANASAAAKLASVELQEAFFKMSGCTLPVLPENEVKIARADEDSLYEITTLDGENFSTAILLGDTTLAQSLTLSSELPSEGYRIKSDGNILFVTGNDTRSDGSPLMGTYYGAISLLERHFKVRWLWPGELGSIYPTASRLGLVAVDEADSPALAQRKVRNAGGVARLSMEPESMDLTDKSEIDRLFEKYKSSSSVRRILRGLSDLQQPFADYIANSKVAPQWFRRQKLGGSFRLLYTHAYDDFYERYGAPHPEWFALQPNGTRKQAPERVRLCKSNHELTDEIARNVLIEAGTTHADSVSISPNDGGAENMFCMCEECRKLDPPNAPLIDFTFVKNKQKMSIRYPAISDRVVDFYNRIAEKVAEKNPEIKLGAYAYSFYRTPPLQHKLSPNIVIGFVGTGYFDDYRLNNDRKSWEGWALQANHLFLRPNALHLGHGFPGVFVHKMDRDIKHFYQTGMIGADYDSIVHHWANQGLNYYVLSRLLWDPSQNVDAIIDDYCQAAFGPAANTIKEYYAKVEELTSAAAASTGKRIDEVLREEEVVNPKLIATGMFLTVAPEVYNKISLEKLQAILDKARGETNGHAKEQARVAFLDVGLQYAKFQSELYRLVNAGKVPSEESSVLMEERRAFFAKAFKEAFFAIGLVEIARRETGLYRQHSKTSE